MTVCGAPRERPSEHFSGAGGGHSSSSLLAIKALTFGCGDIFGNGFHFLGNAFLFFWECFFRMVFASFGNVFLFLSRPVTCRIFTASKNRQHGRGNVARWPGLRSCFLLAGEKGDTAEQES